MNVSPARRLLRVTSLGLSVLITSGCREQVSGPLTSAPMTPATASGVEPASEVQPASHEAPLAPSEVSAPAKPAEVPPVDANPQAGTAGTRPKADREPTKPGEAEKITFDDLIIGMDKDIVYRPWMLSERAKELEGKRIRIAGVMHGGVESQTKIKAWVLLRNKECKFGPGGQADHVAQVVMKEGRTANFTTDTLRVEGTLRVTPSQGKDGNTWYIYTLEDAVLK